MRASVIQPPIRTAIGLNRGRQQPGFMGWNTVPRLLDFQALDADFCANANRKAIMLE
jgi:hypothetical protein